MTMYIDEMQKIAEAKKQAVPARAKLAWLGQQDIAEVLRVRGIKGVRSDPAHCPIAEFLHAEGWGAKVLTFNAYVGPRMGSRLNVQLPVAVSKFIKDFDRGAYPDLVKRIRDSTPPSSTTTN